MVCSDDLAAFGQAIACYNVTGCKSWNCILVAGLTTVVPAVWPYLACRALCGGPCGSTLFVFSGILRPFTSIEASSTLSGSDLRGFARDEATFPNTFVPAFNTMLPLTLTSCAIFASKLLPTTVCELMRLTVLTVSIVPAGIMAASKDDTAKQAKYTAIKSINVFRIILFYGVDL